MDTNALALAAFAARRAFIQAFEAELVGILRPRFGASLSIVSTAVERDTAVMHWTAAGAPLTVTCNMATMPARQWTVTFLGKTASAATLVEAVRAAWEL